MQGTSSTGYGVFGGGGTGVAGFGNGTGVYGTSNGYGVYGDSTGTSTTSIGVHGATTSAGRLWSLWSTTPPLAVPE